MKAFTSATVAALAVTSFAATVKLEQTPCISSVSNSTNSFDVETDKLNVIALPSVCGLKIVSADGIDVNSVKCQAYKDAEGKEKGSAEFTFAKPALISTNPVQESAILCIGSGSIPSAAPTTFAAVTSAAGVPTATGGASPTGGNSTNPSVGGASPSATSNPDQGAASTVSMSFGALALAAISMLFL